MVQFLKKIALIFKIGSKTIMAMLCDNLNHTTFFNLLHDVVNIYFYRNFFYIVSYL